MKKIVLLIIVSLFAFIGCDSKVVDDPFKADITTENFDILKKNSDGTYKANFELILNYAAMSQMINYNDDSDMLKVYPNTVVLEMPEYKNKMFIITDEKNKIQTIVFRGSGNLQNGVTDLDFGKTYSEKLGVNVHNGFLKSCIELDPIAKQHLKKDYQIRLTGSSLGAALAAMYGMFLSVDGYKVDKIVNFGQPRITDVEGREKFKNLPLYRVVNFSDAVPAIPPHRGFGYSHFGTGIILVNNKQFSVYNEDSIEKIEEDAIVSNFWNKLIAKEISIKNHFIDVYYGIMEGYVSGSEYIQYKYKILPEDAE